MGFFTRFFCTAILASASFFASGCEQQPLKIIDKVDLMLSPNLEYIQLSVKFDRSIRSDIEGSFPILRYGDLFVSPITKTTPFEVGFRMDTAIFNDQDVINIDPTTVLPNGANLPLQLNNAVVQLSGNAPVHEQFDIYGYVDILGREWLGVASIFKFINETFPAGITVAQDFFKNATGHAGAVVVVFGPKMRDGRLETPGGIALFGNVARLIEVIGRRAPVGTTRAGLKVYREYGDRNVNSRLARIYRDRMRDPVRLPSEDDFP